MRKLGLFAVAGLLAIPAFSTANAADDTGKLYYKDGTRLEFQDFDMKVNLGIKSDFTYTDYDEEGRSDLGLDAIEDAASFDVHQVRVIFSGNLLNKQFSYKLEQDLRSNGGSGEMKDAWLQWNSDDVKLRWGQTKVPFSRQEMASDFGLEFAGRSVVSDIFSPSRHLGALLHGPIGCEANNYYLGIFNGESDGEGANRAGVDNKVMGVAAVSANLFGDYGSRAYEGDLRDNTDDLGVTGGVSALYGEGTGNPIGFSEEHDGSDFERADVNVDLGMRYLGWSAQSEFYYSHIELDGVEGDAGEADDFGFYVQTGYAMNKEWQLAFRFGMYSPDEDTSYIKDQQEYAFVLNYFLNGHNLKLQTQIGWLVTNANDEVLGHGHDGDVTDLQVTEQLVAYF